MLFVIHAFDKANGHPVRMANYDAHKSFLTQDEKYGVRIIMSGPLVADDGETPIGSHFVVEAADRAAVEAFHHADPFYAAGVWESPSITAFVKRRG